LGDIAEVIEALMQLRVEHPLNVRFINLAAQQSVTLVRDDVTVQVAASIAEEHTFGSIVCSGIADITTPLEASTSSHGRARTVTSSRLEQPLVIMRDRNQMAGPEVTSTLHRVEDALESVGRLIRWRFDVAGEEAVLGPMELHIETPSGPIELYPVPAAYFGDDPCTIAEDGLAKLSELAQQGAEEPLAHQLWREAWDLKYSNPRSSIVIGVSAAEVGLKRLVVDLAPVTRWLMEELPSPPLVRMMTHYLPELEIRASVPRENRCPKGLRKSLQEAVEARNRVVHRGELPGLQLYATLRSVKEFLYLIDYYNGHEWAVTYLSEETRRELGRPVAGR
jgi:hypothetical protein